MQRRCKITPSQKREPVFCVWSAQSGYKEDFSGEELVKCRDASLPGYDTGSKGIELSPFLGIGSCRIMAGKKLACERIIHM
jgi:hypothetical protein